MKMEIETQPRNHRQAVMQRIQQSISEPISTLKWFANHAMDVLFHKSNSTKRKRLEETQSESKRGRTE